MSDNGHVPDVDRIVHEATNLGPGSVLMDPIMHVHAVYRTSSTVKL